MSIFQAPVPVALPMVLAAIFCVSASPGDAQTPAPDRTWENAGIACSDLGSGTRGGKCYTAVVNTRTGDIRICTIQVDGGSVTCQTITNR